MTEDNLINCIYCTLRRPPSAEHVLAKSLGGNLRRPITCATCNNQTLSALDQALAERSLVALSRVAYTPGEAFDAKLGGEHFHYDADRDLHTDVTLTNGFKSHTFPQVHFRYNSDQVMIVGTDRDGRRLLVDFIDKHIANATLDDIHVRQGPVDRCSTARIVMHRTKDGYIRVRSKHDEKQIFAFLAHHWSHLREQLLTGEFTNHTIGNPTIHVNLSVTLDDSFRAIAKTAFNVLATEAGVELALRPEFDPLRDYVLGRDIRHPEPRDPDEIAVDCRFVDMLPSENAAALPTDGHLVSLFRYRKHVMAIVTLYGSHSFLVMLGETTATGVDFAAREFSIDRRRNR
jgi:hypothetical protein